MANLYLIRHGQASFMQKNYDLLSPLGYEQSKALGKYLVENNYQFDACWSGLLERHKGTFQGVQEMYRENNLAIPELLTLEGLNEHQAAEIHSKNLPILLEKAENKGLKKMLEEKGHENPEVKKALLSLFFKGIRLWAKGEIQVAGYEKFTDFKTRVSEGYQFLLKEMEAKNNAIVFTSGGTIGMWLGLVLGLDNEKVIELNWQVRNTSISEISYSKGKFYLRGFNFIPHLKEEKMITYV